MAVVTQICLEQGLEPPRLERVLHLTLCKIGHYGWIESVIETALQIGDRVSGRASRVAMTKVMHFRNSNAVVLTGDETPADLLEFRQGLALELRREGFKPETSFKPHMTFVYEEGFLVPEAPLAQPIWCPVDAFELVSSPPGQQRHDTLKVWPLGPNA